MYDNYSETAIAGTQCAQIEDMTVEDNINRKILNLQRELDRLEKCKKELGPLLHMRIGDLRNAMNY